LNQNSLFGLDLEKVFFAPGAKIVFNTIGHEQTSCAKNAEEAAALAGGFDSVRWDEWWLYCPNSAMLTTIGALQKCSHSPRHVSANAFSHLRLAEN
jgi:hypothetical protein